MAKNDIENPEGSFLETDCMKYYVKKIFSREISTTNFLGRREVF